MSYDHHDTTKPLPWYRDATTGGKAVLLSSAVLCGVIPLLGAWLDIGVVPTMTVWVLQLAAANILVALYMQEDSDDLDDYDDFDDLDEL